MYLHLIRYEKRRFHYNFSSRRIMSRNIFLFTICIALSLTTPLLSGASTDIENKREAINTQLQNTANPKEKAKLYCYLARNYEKTQDIEEAKKNYFKALNTSYDGWILNELGYFMYKHGEYDKAYNISLKVLADFPHLKKDADNLRVKAEKMRNEEYAKLNPPTIIMDSQPDPNRVTRHDLIRKSNQSYSSAAPKSSVKTKKSSNSGGGGSHISGYGTNSAFRRNYIESRKNKAQ